MSRPEPLSPRFTGWAQARHTAPIGAHRPPALLQCGPFPRSRAARSLDRLELLNVSYNRITTLIDLQNTTGLKVLYARSNQISSLGPLCGLIAMHSLDLECNAISSIESLNALWPLQQLSELRMRGNLLPPSAYRQACRSHLPRLRLLDGADATAEPATPDAGAHSPVAPRSAAAVSAATAAAAAHASRSS